MDFIVKLLFLGGKYISQAAGRTILEIYLRSKDIGRHISLQYEKASEIIKPYDNMLELINDRAKETEDDVHIAQMNNSLKKQMEDHVNQMPKMLKSDYVNGLAKNHSLLSRVKQWEQTYANKQAVIENEGGFVEGKESDYDKIYTDLCTDLFRSSPIGVSICNLGLNNLGQTVNDFQGKSKISKASDTNDLRKPYTSETFTEISDEAAKFHHASALEDLDVKIDHPSVDMFDFNTSFTKDKESEDGLGSNMKSQTKYQVNFNANSWQYGKDASYMKYLVEQSPANSYFNAKAIGIESVEGINTVSDKKEQVYYAIRFERVSDLE